MDTLKRRQLYLFPILVLLASLLFSCSAKKEKQLGLLPSAKGEKAEVILVMDSVQWKGTLGEEVRTVFTAETPGLNQPEPLFTLRFIQPFAFQNILRQHKNVVLISTFDSNTSGSRKMQSYFTPESQERIKNEEDLFMLVEENEYAMGQIVIYLFGKDEQTLMRNMKANRDKIRNVILREEEKRLMTTLQKSRNRDLEKNLLDNHQIDMLVPVGYKVVRSVPGFAWLRHVEYDFDKNMVISYLPYTSENQFNPDSIMAYRARIMAQHTRDPDNSAVYVTDEPLEPPILTTMQYEGQYAVDIRGRWRLKDRFVGGTFSGYCTFDALNGRFFYIETFISAPGMDKRDMVREADAIMHTVKFAPSK